MRPHRRPVRDLRTEYGTTSDRLTAYHERRVDALGDGLELATTDDGNRKPTVIVHLAPEGVFEPTGFHRTLLAMSAADVDLYETGRQTRTTPNQRADAYTISRKSDDQMRDDSEHLSLDEYGLLEIVSQQLTYSSSRKTIFAPNSFASLVEENLAVLAGLLAADAPETAMVATATFLGFDGVGANSDYGTLAFEHAARVDAPTVRFVPPGEDHSGEYRAHTGPVDDLLRPLWQSARTIDYPEVEHTDPLPIPDYSLAE